MLQPCAQAVGDELRTVVAADVFRYPVHDHGVGQLLDDLVGAAVARSMHDQAGPAVLVDQGHHADLVAIDVVHDDEVVTSHVIALLRAQL